MAEMQRVRDFREFAWRGRPANFGPRVIGATHVKGQLGNGLAEQLSILLATILPPVPPLAG